MRAETVEENGMAAVAEAVAALGSIGVPALPVAGELDQASPVARNEANAGLIGTELVVLPDTVHIIPWEKP